MTVGKWSALTVALKTERGLTCAATTWRAAMDFSCIHYEIHPSVPYHVNGRYLYC